MTPFETESIYMIFLQSHLKYCSAFAIVPVKPVIYEDKQLPGIIVQLGPLSVLDKLSE